MKAIPTIAVIGHSNSGKTRCVVELVTHLTSRGYRVATAKHCHHGFDLDVEGKDSWKHKQAGAVTTLMSSRNQIGLVADARQELSLDQLCRQYIHEADLLLAEGYSWEEVPKIYVLSIEPDEEVTLTKDPAIFALVGDANIDFTLSHFAFDMLDQLALLIEQKFLSRQAPHPQ